MKAKPESKLVDRDNPEWTADTAERAISFAELPPSLQATLRQRKRGERGPQKTPTKQPVSLRLPPATLARWKATGPGWQTRMADVLDRVVAER